MRTCPVCREPLTERALGGQLIDVCSGCGGQFYDAGELEAIVYLARLVGGVALDEAEVDVVGPPERDEARACPGCGAPMHLEELAGEMIDRCGACEGVWLDGGELAAIRLAELHVKTNLGLYLRLGQ